MLRMKITKITYFPRYMSFEAVKCLTQLKFVRKKQLKHAENFEKDGGQVGGG